MKTKPQKNETPLRRALAERSGLRAAVVDGLGAIASDHRNLFDKHVRRVLSDSLDLDNAVKMGRECESRWDYLVGHEPSRTVLAIEPHSAKQGEIATVIRKRRAALSHLKGHLKDGIHIRRWLWVAAGKVHFANTEKAKILLAQHGIEFIGSQITQSHVANERDQGTRRRKT